MKKGKGLFVLFIFIVLGLFLLLVLDFAALHDIQKEYISKNILEFLDVQLSKDVPYWTKNEGEWNYLNISALLRLFAYIIISGIVIYLYKIKDKKPKIT